MTTPPVVVLTVAARTPASFHGEPYEDVEDWLLQYEWVAQHNGWTDEQRLESLYFALEGTARHWFENRETSLTSWTTCKDALRGTFTNQYRRERVEDLLRMRTQGANETITSFVEDVLHLVARADPQATDKKMIRILMWGVRNDIFGGPVGNPPTTVEAFVTEATNIERALQARASHYQRRPGVAALSPLSCNSPSLRQIIRDVVREETRKVLSNADRPASLSMTENVRDEVQRAFQPQSPVDLAPPEQPMVSCATTALCYHPLCYHCGEADHIYRRCPYREMGLRGFHPKDTRPR